MKSKYMFTLVCIVATVLFVGCDIQNTIQSHDESPVHDCEDIIYEENVTQEESEALLLQEITDLFAPKYSQTELDSAVAYLVDTQGFDPEKLDAWDWGITYDGDLGLPVDDILQDMRNESEAEMRTYFKQPYLVTNTSSIRIATVAYGSFKLPSDWFSATNTATWKWQGLGGELYFSRRHYANYYSWVQNLVWVIPLNFSKYGFLKKHENAIAWAAPLNSGNPSRFIFINKEEPSYANWSENQMKQIMMHEIGHGIGLLHVYAYDDGTQPHLEIDGLPHQCNGDNNHDSVMRAEANSSMNHNFTYCDEQAYYTLY